MFNVFFNPKSSLTLDSKKSNKEKIKSGSLLQINLSPSLPRSSKKTKRSIFQNFETPCTNSLKINDHLDSDNNNIMIQLTHEDQSLKEQIVSTNSNFLITNDQNILSPVEETNKRLNDFNEETNSLISDDCSENSLFEASLTESSMSDDDHFDMFKSNDVKDENELYPNSKISISQFLVSFYALKAKHKLADNTCNDILKLFKLILPDKNKCPKTLYGFEKGIFNSKKVEYSDICRKCLSQSQVEDFEQFILKENLCENCEIEKSVLIRFGLAAQIKEIVEKNHNFGQIIEANHKARSKSDHSIQNALDGKIYQDMIKTVSYDKIIISLNLNTDGCPLVKSKNYTLWPLLGTILELDQSCREKFENMIILGKEIPKIDMFLSEIKFPHFINRKFNKILTDLKYKSSELKLFVFYLAIPILSDILPDDIWFMLCCYVLSVRTFYEPIKNIDELNSAKKLYEKYFGLLDCFFSESAYLYTTHAHLHLFEQVCLHGPLQCHSSFCFEGSLFNLKNLLTGTRGFTNQMVKRIFLIKNLSNELKDFINYENQNLNNFTQKLLGNIRNNQTHLYLPISKTYLNEKENELFMNNFEINLRNKFVLVSNRCKFANWVFHSINYNNKLKRDSYTICYKDNQKEKYGQIVKFFEIEDKFVKMSDHKEYVLVFFKRSNTYCVIDDEEMKLQGKKKAQIHFETGWSTGEILYRGGKIGSANSFFTSESEYDADDSEKRISKKVINQDQVSSKKTPSLQIIEDVPTTSYSNSDNVVEYVEVDRSSSKTTLEQNDFSLFKLYQDVQEIKIEIKEQQKILNEIFKLLKGSKTSQEEWPTEIMYNGTNLLDTHCESIGRYITSLMVKLFTLEERMEGAIIIPDLVNVKSEKTPLSPNRVEIFKKCVLAKAKPPKDQRTSFFVTCCEKANRRCYDAHKSKEAKNAGSSKQDNKGKKKSHEKKNPKKNKIKEISTSDEQSSSNLSPAKNASKKGQKKEIFTVQALKNTAQKSLVLVKVIAMNKIQTSRLI
ncbi:unnamed protein product [Brachionus calyciflorus]|uniref:Uncharacterized protein n=1 Tax=Brachionus calyciflorus TaxID=104777 RepID=A0A814BD25_9BILA|nr:unnamed protein product [Brachionus calyciflorus]